MDENTSDPRRAIVVSPPFAAFYQATHIPAARKAGNRLLLTGHTGDTPDGAYSDDVTTQLRQTFRNIEATLHEAGASWADVVALNSYHRLLDGLPPIRLESIRSATSPSGYLLADYRVIR